MQNNQINSTLSVTDYPTTSQTKQRSQNNYNMVLNDSSFPVKLKFAHNRTKNATKMETLCRLSYHVKNVNINIDKNTILIKLIDKQCTKQKYSKT